MSQLTAALWVTLCFAGIGWRSEVEPRRAPGTLPGSSSSSIDAPQASPDSLRFNADKVPIGAHRFEMVMILGGEERTIGSSDVVVTRVGDNVRFFAVNVAPPIGLSERIEVLLNATSLAVLSHTADMSSGLDQGHSSVSFAAGRAKGRVQQPTPQGGLRTFDVDLPMDDNVTDDAIADLLLATADLSPGMSGTFRSFNLSKGRIEATRVRVAGRETVSVPAGKFEVYRVELNGGSKGVVFLTTAEPHLLVAERLRKPVASTILELELRLVR
jgi:hypothetical protein